MIISLNVGDFIVNTHRKVYHITKIEPFQQELGLWVVKSKSNVT